MAESAPGWDPVPVETWVGGVRFTLTDVSPCDLPTAAV